MSDIKGLCIVINFYAVGQLLHLSLKTKRQDSAEEGEVF